MKVRIQPVTVEVNDERLLAAGLLAGQFKPATGTQIRDELYERINTTVVTYFNELDRKVEAMKSTNE